MTIFKTTALAFCFASAAFAGPFDGVYRGGEGAMGCDLAFQFSDGGPTVIKNNQISGVESLCDLTNPVQIRGINGILYDAKCEAESEVSTSRMMFVKAANGLFMHRRDWVIKLERCE